MVSITIAVGNFESVLQSASIVANWKIDDKDASVRDWVGIWDKEPTEPKGQKTYKHAIGVNTFNTGVAADGTDYWVAYVSESFGGTQKILAKTHFVNRPQTSTLKCGTYNLGPDDPEKVAQHAFASITDEGSTDHWFDCDGGHTSSNDRDFPAELYKPSFYKTGTGQIQEPASLYAANCIAQFTTTPDMALENTKPDDLKILPNYAGLIYGVTGVCHQMCNRVMWSAAKPLGYTYANINYPASLKGSWSAWGFWGSALSMGPGLLLAQQVMGGSTGQENLSDDALAEMTLHCLHEHFESSYGQSEREPFHEALFANFLGLEVYSRYSDAERNFMRAEDLLFYALKRDLDIQLLKMSISHNEYAGTVNTLFADMIRAQADVLPRDHVQKIYSVLPDEGVAYPLIVKDHMHQDYVTIGNKLDL